MTFNVVVEQTLSKRGQPDYITGYTVTGSDGDIRMLYFDRGYQGPRPTLDGGTTVSLGLREGRWITSLELAPTATSPVPADVQAPAGSPAHGGGQTGEAVKAPAEQVPTEVSAAFAKLPGMRVIAVEAPVNAGPAGDPAFRKLAAALIALMYPSISESDKAEFIKRADEAARAQA